MGGDVVGLVVDYAKQETLGPLRGLGRYLAFGLLGSISLAVGLVVLEVAFLRALQTETGSTFAGNLSWSPYAIVTVVSFLLLGLAAFAVVRGAPRRALQRDQEKGNPR
jgi:hypothetical protein